MNVIKVVKRNGDEELFQVEKLKGSIEMAGIKGDIALQISKIISDSLDSHISTEEIFQKTRDFIYKHNPGAAALYALERGLSALGPSGFVFEQYVAALFEEMAYRVQTNVYLEGEGVTHEIDVFAEKGNVVFIVEAKYRNDYKTKTHINQIMYADARLQDVRRQAQKNGDNREFYMWVVTNTKFTDNAIHYVAYRDVQLMGWNFPPYINLMKIVYEKKLYPVTILPSITKSALEKMASKELILVKNLIDYDLNEMREKFSLSMTLAKKLYKEVHELMENKTL